MDMAKKIIKELIPYVLIVGIVLLFRFYVFSPIKVDGSSMDPTLHNGEKIFTAKQSKIDRGDIVSFIAPDAPKKQYIKRVIGLPGDTVYAKNGVVYVNDKPLDEPYLKNYVKQFKDGQLVKTYGKLDNAAFFQSRAEEADNFTEDFSMADQDYQKVPKNSYFVMGDNRIVSHDSREIGVVSADKITGEAKFIFWPPSKIGFVK